jgi:hypothetical protein
MFILLMGCLGILEEPIIRQTPAEDESNAKLIMNEQARVKEKTDQCTAAYPREMLVSEKTYVSV